MLTSGTVLLITQVLAMGFAVTLVDAGNTATVETLKLVRSTSDHSYTIENKHIKGDSNDFLNKQLQSTMLTTEHNKHNHSQLTDDRCISHITEFPSQV